MISRDYKCVNGCVYTLQQLEEMSQQLSAVRQELLSHKLTSAEEIISYKQQVKALQKVIVTKLYHDINDYTMLHSLEFDQD